MKEITFFNTFSIWKVLGVVVLFPMVIFIHLFNIFFYFTNDFHWGFAIAMATTLYIMAVLYVKLFTGMSFLASISFARGTVFLIAFFVVTSMFIANVFLSNEVLMEMIERVVVGDVTKEKMIGDLTMQMTIYVVLFSGMEFLGLLGFFGLSSVIREGTK